MADNRIDEHVVKISADTSGVNAPLDRAEKKLNQLDAVAKKFGSTFSNVFKKSAKETDDMSNKLGTLGDSFKSFDMKKVQSEIDRTAKKFDTLNDRKNKMKSLGTNLFSKGFKSLRYDIDSTKIKMNELNNTMSAGLKSEIQRITAEMQKMEGLVVPTDAYVKLQENADKAAAKLETLYQRQEALRKMAAGPIANTEQYKAVSSEIEKTKTILKGLESELENFSHIDMYNPSMQKVVSSYEEQKSKLEELKLVRRSMLDDNGPTADLSKWITLNDELSNTKAKLNELYAARTALASADKADSEEIRNVYLATQTAAEEYKRLNEEIANISFPNMDAQIAKFKAVDAQIQELTESIEINHDSIEAARNDGKLYSESYNALINKISETETHLQDLRQQQESMKDTSVIRETTAWKNLSKQIDRAEVELAGYKSQLSSMRDNKIAFVSGIDTSAYQEARSQIESLNQKLTEVEANSSSKLSQIGLNIKHMFGTVVGNAQSVSKTVLSVIGSGFKKAFTSAGKSVKSLTSHLGNFNKQSLSVSKVAKKMTRTLTSLFTMLRGRILRLGIAKVFEDIQKNINTLALISPRFNAAISGLIDSAKQLGAQIIAAIEPVVSVLGPIISTVIDKLTEGADALSQFFARITGNQEYLKAKKGNSNYAASLDETTKKTKNASKATKEYKNTILGFDEIHKLNGNDGYDDMLGIDDAKIDKALTEATALNTIADEIREAFKKSDYRGAGKAMAKGVNLAFAWLDDVAGWSKNVDKFTNVLKNFKDVVNGFVDGLDVETIGFAIGDIANTIINGLDILTDPTDGINFYAIGNKIGQILLKAVTTIEWDKLGKGLVQSVQGGVKLLNGLLESTIKDEMTGKDISIGTAIGQALNDMFTGAIKALNPDDWSDLIANVVNNTTDLIIAFFGDGSQIAELANKIADTINQAVEKINTDDLAAAISALAKGFVTFADTLFHKIQWKDVWNSLCDVLKSESFDWKSILEAMGILAVPGIISSLIGKGLSGSMNKLSGVLAGVGIYGATDLVAKNIEDPLAKAVTKVTGSMTGGAVAGGKIAGPVGAGVGAAAGGVAAVGQTGYELGKNIKDRNKALKEMGADFSNVTGGIFGAEWKSKMSLFTQAVEDANGQFVAFDGYVLSSQQYLDMFNSQLDGLNAETVKYGEQTYNVTEQMRELAQKLVDQGTATTVFTMDLSKMSSELFETKEEVEKFQDSVNTVTTEFSDSIMNTNKEIDTFSGNVSTVTQSFGSIDSELTRIHSELASLKFNDNDSILSIIHTDYGDAGRTRIPGFASGGIVGDGQLFIANEGGTAELIGDDGRGNTAVVNNGQIISAMTTAFKSVLYEVGMDIADRIAEADSSSGGETRMVLTSEAGEVIAREVDSYKSSQSRRGNHSVTFG